MQQKCAMGCFGLALALAAAAGLKADTGFGVRVAGGYGFGLNSDGNGEQIATLAEDSGGSLPLSDGIPTQAEVLYRVLPQFQVGLGVFPVFGLNESANLLSGLVATTEKATLSGLDAYPILLSAYFDQPLGHGFSAFAGLGFGVVPAGSFDLDISSSTGEKLAVTEDLNAAFAVRGVLGVDYAFTPNVKLGLQVQDLVFDSTVDSESVAGIEGLGWTGMTYDYNQVAPMLFVEGDF